MINNIESNLDLISKRKEKTTQQSNKDRLTAFIHILTTQLQNQDPTSPLETKDFSQLLTSLITVDQNTKTNDYLEEMVNLQKLSSKNNEVYNQAQLTGVVSYINHDVVADCNIAALTPEGANFSFQIDNPAESVIAQIYDKNHSLVSEQDLGRKKSGINKFLWEGIEGTIGEKYQLEINAFDKYGNQIKTNYSIKGSVKSVDVSNNQHISLLIDNQTSIDLNQVSSVSSK